MNNSWPIATLGELLRLERRPVTVEVSKEYREIGIYCFGKGVFHKAPRSGLEVGDKNLFRLKEGDLILQVTFAWEGAIAIVSSAEEGMYGSTRYPTFRVDESRCEPLFLLNYLRTPEGLEQLGKICPGSAGRNRVLSIKRMPEVKIPLPPIGEQKRIVRRIGEFESEIEEACRLRQEATKETEALIGQATASLLDSPGWPTAELRAILAEKPRNGLGPQQVVESGGRSMLRINAVSSSKSRYVDMTAVKMVDVADAIAKQFVIMDDDVFIVRYNGDIKRVAKPAIYKGENEARAVYPDKLMRLRVRPERMTPDFLVFALSARSVRSQIEELGKTTAGNIGINGSDAQSFVLPVPPLPEQHRIVVELDTLQTEVEALTSIQNETAKALAAMLPSVLNSAFTGNI